MSASSTLAIINNSKAQNKTLAATFIQEIEDGVIDPIKAHIYLKSIEDLLNNFFDGKSHPDTVKRYKELVVDEAIKNGKRFEKYGATFEVKEAGTQYDWSVCNDSVLDELIEKAKFYKDEVTKRQDFLKMIPSEGVANPSNGELVYPPNKTSTTSLTVKLQ